MPERRPSRDPAPVDAWRGRRVPPDLRALSTWATVDDIDLHRLRTADATRWAPEAWARAMFEDDRLLRQRVRRLGLLGLLLQPTQPAGCVAGWTIASRGPGCVRLESRSALTSDQVVVHVEADGVALLTTVRYDRRAAAVVWPLVAILHRRFAPRVLRRAQASLRAGR